MQDISRLILNHVNPNVHGTGQEKPGMGTIRGLNLAAVRTTIVQLTNCSFRIVT
jgi:hypothetical protein